MVTTYDIPRTFVRQEEGSYCDHTPWSLTLLWRSYIEIALDCIALVSYLKEIIAFTCIVLRSFLTLTRAHSGAEPDEPALSSLASSTCRSIHNPALTTKERVHHRDFWSLACLAYLASNARVESHV